MRKIVLNIFFYISRTVDDCRRPRRHTVYLSLLVYRKNIMHDTVKTKNRVEHVKIDYLPSIFSF